MNNKRKMKKKKRFAGEGYLPTGLPAAGAPQLSLKRTLVPYHSVLTPPNSIICHLIHRSMTTERGCIFFLSQFLS
jgi:hypothetical protein